MLQVELFGRDKHSKDGLSFRCKPCNREYEAQRRKANPEAHRSKVKRWAEKNSEAIAAYREQYRERRREIDAIWQAANRDKVNEKSRRWRERNREKVAAYNQKYRAERPEVIAKIKKDWIRRNPEAVAAHGVKRRAVPKYKLEAAVRSRVHATLAKGAKSDRTFNLLGYSPEDLKDHLERQFTKGMSWANYGQWHVDHIVPLSTFSYQTPDDPDFRSAWALTNLRPLWGEANVSKGAKRLTLL